MPTLLYVRQHFASSNSSRHWTIGDDMLTVRENEFYASPEGNSTPREHTECEPRGSGAPRYG
jgi:hypothetical protein